MRRIALSLSTAAVVALAALVAAPAQAQQMTRKEYIAAKKAEAAAIREAQQTAYKELTALKAEMAALGMKGEVTDCEKILEKCMDPTKGGDTGGSTTPWPGEEVYFTKVLDRFAEVGQKLSPLYLTAASKIVLNPELKERYEVIGTWLGTFPTVAARMKHFNDRRKEMKLGPVTCSWGMTYGGFMHGRYMVINAGKEGTAGLGAHNENNKFPGASPEGAAAAKGIGGGGWFDGWLGSMFHRDPVFQPRLARIRFGGYKHSWWCKKLGGSNDVTTDLVTWPGDGATNISGVFSGEHPNPLPEGVQRCGTMIVILYLKGKPKNFRYRLLDPSGTEITDLIVFDKARHHVFSARQPLKGGKYTVELLGDGYKSSFSFTVGAGPYNTGRRTPRRPEPKTPEPEKKPEVKGPLTGGGAGGGDDAGAGGNWDDATERAEREAIERAAAEREKAEAAARAAKSAAEKARIDAAAAKGKTPAQKAVYRALAQKFGSPGYQAAVAEFGRLWAAMDVVDKIELLDHFGIPKLGRLGVSSEEMMSLREKADSGMVDKVRMSKALKLAGDAEYATGANLASMKAGFTAIWAKLSVDGKLKVIENVKQPILLKLGVDKGELEELSEFN